MSNDIRDVFKRFRDALNETEEKQNGVPYTQQDEILQTSMQSATEAFGADFSSLKTPMFYHRQDGDVTLSGIIPSLNDAKFQFSYKNGCSFWSGDGQVKLNDENLTTITRMYGVYKNWKQEINGLSDKKPMNMKNE
ncbi:MAG: hypothetical protein J6O41_05095 [Clostridia bacterium]|nr:hypothetical protein [Clostridia bacterium]